MLVSFEAHAAAPAVGQKASLQFQDAISKQTVNLEQLKGKIVVVDFWASWCGPCMAEADHLVAINKEYGSKGLQMLGINMDADASAMRQVVKEKGFDWPHQFDGRGWDNAIANQWDVHSIPKTFLIGPDGTLLWSGHSARLDKPLKEAFEKTPPQLVDPKVLADANAKLDEVDQAIASKNAAKAVSLLGQVPEAAMVDAKFAERRKKLDEAFQQSAKDLLAEIDPLIEQKQYAEAMSRLRGLVKALAGSPAAAEAQSKLGKLRDNPEAKGAIEMAEKTAKGDEMLKIAQKLQADKKHDLAYPRFKEVTTLYAGTEPAKTAAEAVAEYEKDKAFVQRVNESSVAGKAQGMLSMAANYKKAGKTDQAKQKYQDVMNQFPGTRFADQAKKELAAMK